MNTESEPVSIAYDHVEVAYPAALRPIVADFTISPGEKFAILGPSGGGKSTLVKVAAGLIRGNDARKKWFALKSTVYHSGRLMIAGRDVSNSEPFARAISLISQHSNLYPHMTVGQNLELVTPTDTAKELVVALLEELGIGHLLERMPGGVSGGESQRVAVAKAILRKSSCVAFDEPMTGLDQHLRIGLTTLIREVLRRHTKTLLLVSHDQETTLGIADRIAFLDKGQILQISPPEKLVDNPAHPVVASTIDPFFRVHLDRVEPTPFGFRVGPVAFRGICMPAEVKSIVVNTRKIVERNSSVKLPLGWDVSAKHIRRNFVGGQAVLAISLECSDSDWNVPLANNETHYSSLNVAIPLDGIFAFDQQGRRLKL